MIFTADLDRTLIYSQRRLTETPPVIPAEYRLGRPCGFLTVGALAALRDIQRQTVCLINTLRGLEQTNRVLFARDGSCRYLALQNGLYLYRDGVLDTAWSDFVSRTVGELPIGLAQGSDLVLRNLRGIECLSKSYAYLSVFFVTEDFDEGLCLSLASELATKGWALYRQRRKLYLYPCAIDKGTVLRRVQELEGQAEAIGCGDSYFDLPMLRVCQEAYAPSDCELAGTDWGFPIHYSKRPAQAGTEELLRCILRRLDRAHDNLDLGV